jgi:hypothetical protein
MNYEEKAAEILKKHSEEALGLALVGYMIRKKLVPEDFLASHKKWGHHESFMCKSYSVQIAQQVVLNFWSKEDAEDFQAEIFSARSFNKVNSEASSRGLFFSEIKIYRNTVQLNVKELMEMLNTLRENVNEVLDEILSQVRAKDLKLI